ncbi:MAG: exonuclease subunit SbcD [Prolixibacteraceae bacterium]|nr:exonuclease subunit SbcD [Prolixibacteraceae bacterium]MBN2648296.1 exonuclease subunit SbcD [Prolixibacteraceae bacterium]
MKILHTSDWHLGKRLENFQRIEEQAAVMNEICQVANEQKADAVLVAGDLFDTYNPSTEAVNLCYKTLKRLSCNGTRPIIVIAGNHDSPDRIETPDPLARECGIIFVGYPNTKIENFVLDSGLKLNFSEKGFIELSIPGNNSLLRIICTPYANEFRLKTFLDAENSEQELREVLAEKWQMLANNYCDENGVNVLLSHLFMIPKGERLPVEPDDEKPILHVGGAQAIYTENIPSQVQYVAMGHLHRMHRVGKTLPLAYYSGSPLSYSFAEADQRKYVLLVDAEPGKDASIREIELSSGKKLLRKRAESVDEAIEWLEQHYQCLVELTLVTDTFLTAGERKKLYAAHSGIVSIIPEVRNAKILSENQAKGIDLSRNMEELFIDFFTHERNQKPDAEILSLFKELLAVGE